MLTSLKQRIPVRYKQYLSRSFSDIFDRIEYQVLRIILLPLEMLTGRYISYVARPRYAKGVRIMSDAAERDYSEYAIVLQGPLAPRNHFTIETLLLYKKNFPGAALILSTWANEDPAVIAEAREMGAEVVLSEPLASGEPGNINRQIITSRAGIARARAMGRTYVLKSRPDQRMYNPRLLSFLSDMLVCFPVAPGTARGRIIGTSSYVGRKKLYLFTDLLIFGYLEDMENYFNPPLVQDPKIRLPFLEPRRPFSTEAYLCWQYTMKIGYPTATTEDEYNSMLARHFCVVDDSSLDWFWHKYHKHHFKERRLAEYGRAIDVTLNFPFWLELYKKEQAKTRG